MHNTRTDFKLATLSYKSRMIGQPDYLAAELCCSINQSINQSIKLFVTRAASCTELESEAWAIASGRVLRIVIEKVGLEASFESI